MRPAISGEGRFPGGGRWTSHAGFGLEIPWQTWKQPLGNSL